MKKQCKQCGKFTSTNYNLCYNCRYQKRLNPFIKEKIRCDVCKKNYADVIKQSIAYCRSCLDNQNQIERREN